MKRKKESKLERKRATCWVDPAFPIPIYFSPLCFFIILLVSLRSFSLPLLLASCSLATEIWGRDARYVELPRSFGSVRIGAWSVFRLVDADQWVAAVAGWGVLLPLRVLWPCLRRRSGLISLSPSLYLFMRYDSIFCCYCGLICFLIRNLRDWRELAFISHFLSYEVSIHR